MGIVFVFGAGLSTGVDVGVGAAVAVAGVGAQLGTGVNVSTVVTVVGAGVVGSGLGSMRWLLSAGVGAGGRVRRLDAVLEQQMAAEGVSQKSRSHIPSGWPGRIFPGT